MGYLRVKVPDNSKKFLEELLLKLGFEVTDENSSVLKSKSSKTVSPTFLSGKWKDIDINPVTFRKKLWAREK